MPKPILYSYFRSTASWRVRIALAIKGIQYEYRPVHLLNGEQNNPEYLRLNPMGQVPVLIIDDRTLSQSVSILEYLEETRKDKPLLPLDPYKRAQVREIVEMFNSGIHPITNLSSVQRHSKEKKEQIEWLKYWGTTGFKAVEERLKKSAGKFCVENEITLADLFLVPQSANVIRWGVDLKSYPKICEIYQRLSALKPFELAHPSVQPDCPEKLRQPFKPF